MVCIGFVGSILRPSSVYRYHDVLVSMSRSPMSPVRWNNPQGGMAFPGFPGLPWPSLAFPFHWVASDTFFCNLLTLNSEASSIHVLVCLEEIRRRLPPKSHVESLSLKWYPICLPWCAPVGAHCEIAEFAGCFDGGSIGCAAVCASDLG